MSKAKRNNLDFRIGLLQAKISGKSALPQCERIVKAVTLKKESQANNNSFAYKNNYKVGNNSGRRYNKNSSSSSSSSSSKKQKEGASIEDAEKELELLLQQKRNQWVYHQKKEIRRSVKKAVGFQKQKLTKFIKRAKEDKSSEDKDIKKLQKYESDLDELKKTDVDIFASIVVACLSKKLKPSQVKMGPCSNLSILSGGHNDDGKCDLNGVECTSAIKSVLSSTTILKKYSELLEPWGDSAYDFNKNKQIATSTSAASKVVVDNNDKSEKDSNSNSGNKIKAKNNVKEKTTSTTVKEKELFVTSLKEESSSSSSSDDDDDIGDFDGSVQANSSNNNINTDDQQEVVVGIDGKKDTKKKKNRLGQNARKRLWEQQYGGNAKHIQEKIKKARMEKQTPEHNASEPPSVEDETLHPSWHARLKQRAAMEVLKSVPVNKITFDDDSD